MSLDVVNLTEAAGKLERPFTLAPVAAIRDLAISLYVCQGQISWHRHPDEDELFLVHEGVVTLETERGRLTLHSEELVVVPKGVQHRSGSQLRSVVVLIRPVVLTPRRNGHRRHAVDTDPPLEKVRLARVLATLPGPYQAVTLAQVEDFDLLLLSAVGEGPETVAPEYGAFWLVVRGAVVFEVAGAEPTALEAGELTIVPKGTPYRLNAAQSSLLVTLARRD